MFAPSIDQACFLRDELFERESVARRAVSVSESFETVEEGADFGEGEVVVWISHAALDKLL